MNLEEMESRTLASVVNIVDISGLVPLSEITRHRLTEECPSKIMNVSCTSRIKVISPMSS